MVGVAGAGKTTMLRAVAEAFGDAGYRVFGTATSGQAARNLGRGAEIGESRTLASLIWRLDHGRPALDDRSVVMLDEAGMTDDIDLARLAAHVEAARSKLVLVGDHRQLAAVGPGGALHALADRHPDAVHRLVENRRQHDPEERQVLAELRDGEVGRAVAWYEQHGRINPVPDRDAALQAAVDAWAADLSVGKQASMYAWKRGNVTALNDRTRAWMNQTGRLSGPEVVCPGGLVYRAGDHVVTPPPNPAAPSSPPNAPPSKPSTPPPALWSSAPKTAGPSPSPGTRPTPSGSATVRDHRPSLSGRHRHQGAPLRRRRRPRARLRGHEQGP